MPQHHNKCKCRYNNLAKAINKSSGCPKEVTGLGCTATALCGAFSAVNPDFCKAAAHAMAIMGIAGEMSAETAKGPGSFQVAFIDALYRISEQEIEHYLKV